MRHLSLYVPLSLFSLFCPSMGADPAAIRTDVPPRGEYVEARTASVFAGACHYGSEYTTRGREALLAWHCAAGSWRGVDLSGVNVVLAVAGDQNLDEDGGSRHALVYTDLKASPEQRAASVDFVLARCKALAGEVREVKCADLTVVIEGESYSVAAPGLFEIRGSKLENRECCKMPYDVWYAPFVNVVNPIVGCNAIFQFEDRALGPIWKRSGQNESFVGSFDLATRTPAELSHRAVVASASLPANEALMAPSSTKADRR